MERGAAMHFERIPAWASLSGDVFFAMYVSRSGGVEMVQADQL